MKRNLLKIGGAISMGLGLFLIFFWAGGVKAGGLGGYMTMDLNYVTGSEFYYHSGSTMSIPQGYFVDQTMMYRWNLPGGGYQYTTIAYGYSGCPTGATCKMYSYDSYYTEDYNGRNYKITTFGSISNYNYSPFLRIQTSSATPPGTYTIYLTAFEYPAACSSGSCATRVDKTMTLTVTPGPYPPSGVDIKANGSDGPITILKNTSANLSWTSTNATSCSVSPGSLTGTSNTGVSSGNISTASKTYTLTCTNSYGSTSDSVVINTQDAPTVSISANPTSGLSPFSSTLTWTTGNSPTSCTASDDWSGSKSISGGTQTITNITSAKKFTITCINAVGNASASANVTIQTPTSAPTVTLSANPSNANAPFSSVLTWTTGNTPTSCTASGDWSGTKSASGGNQTINNISTDKNFIITCTNSGGTASSSVAVTPNSPGGGGLCTPPTTGTITAPTSASVNSTFEVRCDFGSASDYIPAPTGCVWPGSNGGHVGSAATFTCTAPATPQNVTYTCQSTNQPGYTYTKWCSLPTPVSKTVSIVIPVITPTVTISANPTNGISPLSSNISWTTSNSPTSCTASGDWSGTKSASGGNQNITGITTTSTYTITCSNSAGTSAPASVTVTPTTTYSLSVIKTYGGSVKSSDSSVNCGSTCANNYPSGTTVTLKAYPDSSQWKFIGWQGSCSGTGDCIVTINGAKTVTAQFALKPLIYQEF